MDDKDRIGEAKGSEDALRPGLAGGERAGEGESGSEPRAAGTPADPVHPGETQPGEAVEQAQQRGGPVDVTPARPHRGR